MKQVKIDSDLKAILPDFTVGVLSFDATIKEIDYLDELINDIEKTIKSNYQLQDILQIPNILAARNGYKKLGKDPSRYRLAVESLYRRIVKNNSLYRINNLVDLGNILSLKTIRSTAVLDYDQIKGEEVLIRIGKNEPYEGIGRGKINVENIPVYCDQKGPFGSPTSDTKRTMITDNTKKILLLIISFNGNTNLLEDIENAKSLYEQYASATNILTEIVN